MILSTARRPLLLGAVAIVLAAGITAAVAVTGGGTPAPSSGPSTAGRVAPGIDPAAVADPAGQVAALQARLRVTPKDQRAWSTLALAYVEQARITADPTYYGKADKALARAAALAPDDSVLFTAGATLAAARHQFGDALAAADKALSINPYSAQAEAVRADALTELGRYNEAAAAASKADDLDPGSSTFARLSYQAELRGNLTAAADLMRRSEEAAGRSASSYAFAAFHLGELARAQGDLAAAGKHYADALGAQPTYLPALAGQARLAVARGDIGTAERDYLKVVQGLPLTEYVVELGELYEVTGRPELARQQYAVAVVSAKLLAANGVATDLETAIFQADHGSATEALTAARGEWSRRHSIHVADALAWALHVNGKDREALGYAKIATRLGTRDARILFHRGAIEAALHLPGARGHLQAARTLDAGVSPWRDKAIAALLAKAIR